MNDVIHLSEVSAGYAQKKVVQNVTLSVQSGEILTLVGTNGCGKSTLLKTIARQIPILCGEIEVYGKKLHTFSQKELAKTIAILPQSRAVPSISVEQLVLHGRFPYLGLSRRANKTDHEKVEQAMVWTGITDLRNRDLRTLSGGERQKAYLSMVLAQDTDLIFLDEPTTYLDLGKQFELLELVQTLNQKGKTIVMVLHELSLALTYSHRIAVIQNGMLQCVQSPDMLFDSGILQKVFHIAGHRAMHNEKKFYYFTMSE